MRSLSALKSWTKPSNAYRNAHTSAHAQTYTPVQLSKHSSLISKVRNTAKPRLCVCQLLTSKNSER